MMVLLSQNLKDLHATVAEYSEPTEEDLKEAAAIKAGARILEAKGGILAPVAAPKTVRFNSVTVTIDAAAVGSASASISEALEETLISTPMHFGVN